MSLAIRNEFGKNIDVSINGFPSIEQLSQEGELFRYGSSFTTSTFPTTRPTVTLWSQILSLDAVPDYGRALLVYGFHISGDSSVAWLLATDQGRFSNIQGSISSEEGILGPNGGSDFSNSRFIVYEKGGCRLKVYSGSTAKPYVAAGFNAINITADFHFKAKYIYLLAGDSTTVGSMGTDVNGANYIGQDLYAFRITNKLRASGFDCRLVNKGKSSETSRQFFQALQAGYYDVEYDVFNVSYGLNDANVGNTYGAIISISEYKSNLIAAITHRNNHRPHAPVIFFAPSPTDLSSIAGNIQTYRDACQDVATNTANGGGSINNVWFYDQSTAFTLSSTPSTDINIRDIERAAGQRLHPSGLAHGLIANGAYTVLDLIPFIDKNRS